MACDGAVGAGGYDAPITGKAVVLFPITSQPAHGRCLESARSCSRRGPDDLTLHSSPLVRPGTLGPKVFFGRGGIGSQRGHRQNPATGDFQKPGRHCRDASDSPHGPAAPPGLTPGA